MTESDEIEEILYEAHYLGISDKVMEKANDWMNRKNMPKGIAYRRALERYRSEGKLEIGSGGTFHKGKTPSNK